MAEYENFTTARATPINQPRLLTILRANVAPETGITLIELPLVRLKKNDPWTPAERAAAQSAIDTAQDLTLRAIAQNEIDAWPISQRALVLALIDKINDIDANLATLLAAVNALNAKTSTAPTTLPNSVAQVTPQQALASIRNKAGTL